MLNLAEYARIRALSDRIGIDSLEREGKAVVFKFRPDAKLDPVWLLKLVQSRGDLTLLPPAILRLDLTRPVDPPKSAGTVKPAVAPAGRLNPKTPVQPRTPDAPGRESWWATRATSGQVSSGFSRVEILAEVPPDPRAPGGVFERVRQVLDDLARRLGREPAG
jgi:hypothetical protein